MKFDFRPFLQAGHGTNSGALVHTCISLVENRLSLTAIINNEVSFIVWEKECLGCQNSPTLLTWPSPVTNPLSSLAEGGVTT